MDHDDEVACSHCTCDPATSVSGQADVPQSFKSWIEAANDVLLGHHLVFGGDTFQSFAGS